MWRFRWSLPLRADGIAGRPPASPQPPNCSRFRRMDSSSVSSGGCGIEAEPAPSAWARVRSWACTSSAPLPCRISIALASCSASRACTLLDLLGKPLRALLVQPPGQHQAERAPGPAPQCRRQQSSAQRAARGHDGPGAGQRADIDQAADQPALGSPIVFLGNIGDAHRLIVFQLGALAIGMAELQANRLLAGQEADLGPIETRFLQIVDRVFQHRLIAKDADHLAHAACHLWRRIGARASFVDHDAQPMLICVAAS